MSLADSKTESPAPATTDDTPVEDDAVEDDAPVEAVAEVEDGEILGGVALEEVEVKIGDRLLLDRACTVVIRHLPREDGRHKLESFIDVDFKDIAGLETAKEAIKEAIEYPITHKDLYEFFGKRPPEFKGR